MGCVKFFGVYLRRLLLPIIAQDMLMRFSTILLTLVEVRCLWVPSFLHFKFMVISQVIQTLRLERLDCSDLTLNKILLFLIFQEI